MRKPQKSKARTAALIKPRAASTTLLVTGATSILGERWINVTLGEKSAWVPFVQIATDPSRVKGTVAQSGMLLIGSRWSSFVEQVASLDEYPARPLIDQPGWSGVHFALPSGHVFSPRGAEEPVVVFDPNPLKCAASGTAANWRRKVAKPLVDQALPSFGMMLAFVAPLLKFTDRISNFGFELVGLGGKGKSTVQQLMSSALGGPVPSPSGHYWITLDATRAGISIALREHSDLPLILEEANLFSPGESDRVRGTRMKDLAFQLSSGHEKLKQGVSHPRAYRFVYLLSTNQSLRELAIGSAASPTSAAADRLMTIPVPDEGGVFNSCPKAFAGRGEFAKVLLRCAREQHGTAIRRFLQKLVQHRADREENLAQRIEHHIVQFCRTAGIKDDDDGSPRRVAEAFGLVVAAGRLAQHYRVLPRSLDCEAVALACYRLHCPNADRKEAGILEQLVQISRDPKTISLNASKLRNLTTRELDEHGVFIHRNRRGQTELLFWPPAFQRRFRDFGSVLRKPEVAAMMKGEKGRKTLKRAIRQGREDRVYCFVLPS